MLINGKDILSLLRWKNLLIIALTQWLFSAAGNIINDYLDIEIDKINKPNQQIIGNTITKKSAKYLYLTLNILGILLGTIVGITIHSYWFGLLFLAVVFLLFLYSRYFKRQFLIGNIVVSILSALPIHYIWLVFYLSDKSIIQTQPDNLFYLIFYMSFAFLMSLIREIIKDIEDIDGDRENYCHTLPIKFGITTAKMTTAVIFTIASIGLAIAIDIISLQFLRYYFQIFLIFPMLLTFLFLIKAKDKKDFKRMSIYLKIIMLLGIMSMVLIN